MSDLDGKCFVKRNGALVPADFAADDFLSELPEGKEIIMSVRMPRSPKHHRWFFALLHKVSDNSDRWGAEDDLLDDLKHAVGHVRRRVNAITGEIMVEARSISWASMGELKFRRFVNRCLHVLAEHLGVTPEELKREVDATQVDGFSPSLVPDQPAIAYHQRERV